MAEKRSDNKLPQPNSAVLKNFKEFRPLRADEIDCRVKSVNAKGVMLLLYKDARCDMAILDETFGPFGWQREHTRDNANCIVSIKDPITGEWVKKEDTGVESRNDAQKGLASDSFKRACTNWGIGRELYTAPFIWVPAVKTIIEQDARGTWKCNDKLKVAKISYDNMRRINGLAIVNGRGELAYLFDNTKNGGENE